MVYSFQIFFGIPLQAVLQILKEIQVETTPFFVYRFISLLLDSTKRLS
jgi:hypothetical protein